MLHHQVICIDINITIHTNVRLYLFIIMKIDKIIDKSVPYNLKHNDVHVSCKN